MLRRPFLVQTVLLALALCVPLQRVCAEDTEYEDVNNFRTQKGEIETRINALQRRIDEASAEKTYCTAEQRQADLRYLRSLRREVVALAHEYDSFKSGASQLAVNPVAGPHLNASNVHPERRDYWIGDDKKIEKLQASSLAKANEVEQANIIDCEAKGAAPATTPPPAAEQPKTSPPPETKKENTPKPASAPPQPSEVVPPPTAPLGGRLPGTYCTEQERTDELLRLQEELINTDGTTPKGRARQQELQRDIQRAKDAKVVPCGSEGVKQGPRPRINLPLGETPQVPPKQRAVPKQLPQTAGQIGEIPIDPWMQMKWQAWDLLEDLDEASWYCDVDAVKELIPELEDLTKQVREAAKAARAAGKFSKIDAAEAEDLAKELENAAAWARLYKGCPLPLKESTTTPKPSTGKPGKPAQPVRSGKSSLSDLFKAPEKPTPPKHSIVEDLVEPPTLLELRAIDSRVAELGRMTTKMSGAPACSDEKLWDSHVAKLEELAKRAAQIAAAAKAGQAPGIDPAEAEQAAKRAQIEVERAKQYRAQSCPRTTTPPKPEKSGAIRVPGQSPPLSSQTQPPPEIRTAAQEYDSIYNGVSVLMLGFALSKNGCDQQQLQAFIGHLEDLGRRAQALAGAAKEGGEYSAVNPERAQQLADHIQRHIAEAKQAGAVDCPAGVRFVMSPWDGKIVAIHNQERMAVGAQPLLWDPFLAAHATAYAQELARTGRLVHAPREGRGIERENLGQGRLGWSPDQIITNEWISEKRDFVAGYFPNVARDGN